RVARRLGCRGPVATPQLACASGTHAIALATDWVRSGRADVVLAGGADLLCRFVVAGFNCLRATAEAARPFDAARRGLVLGEGGGGDHACLRPGQGSRQLHQGSDRPHARRGRRLRGHPLPPGPGGRVRPADGRSRHRRSRLCRPRPGVRRAATPSGGDCRVDLVGLRRRERGPRSRAGGMSAAAAPETRAGIVLGTAFGCFLTNAAYQRRLAAEGPPGASPRLFAATVSNAAAGELAIAYRLAGPAVTVTAGGASGLAALGEAI